jgi:curved DNA-binding protein CbpA
MTDHFALLKEPRRPWLDTEALKSKFLQLSHEVHPDRLHNAPEREKYLAHQRYLELNAAYACLREPKDRLLHLLELELGSRPKEVQIVAPGTMELFLEVGQLCRNVDAFLAERAQATAPMLKVQLFGRAQQWMDKLIMVQERVNATRAELEGELRSLNPVWDGAPAPGHPGRTHALALGRLEQIHRVFSYVSRWQAQIRERLVQLSF